MVGGAVSREKMTPFGNFMVESMVCNSYTSVSQLFGFNVMLGAGADYWIAFRVCETLHGIHVARSKDEEECLLDMLVTAGHCPRFGARERETLYRLADLLAISWSKSWEQNMALESRNRDCFRVKCFVPPQDASRWENVLDAAETNAAMFGMAATTLRYVQTLLPHNGDLLRTESWVHVGQQCLSTCAQLLRQSLPDSRSAGPSATVALSQQEDLLE